LECGGLVYPEQRRAAFAVEKCEVHNRVTRYQPTPQEQAPRKKEALAECVEKLWRVRVLEAIRKGESQREGRKQNNPETSGVRCSITP